MPLFKSSKSSDKDKKKSSDKKSSSKDKKSTSKTSTSEKSDGAGGTHLSATEQNGDPTATYPQTDVQTDQQPNDTQQSTAGITPGELQGKPPSTQQQAPAGAAAGRSAPPQPGAGPQPTKVTDPRMQQQQQQPQQKQLSQKGAQPPPPGQQMPGPMGSAFGSMYGGQPGPMMNNMSSMYGLDGGNMMMGPMGPMMGSMYGMPMNAGSMYGPYGMGSMYGMGGMGGYPGSMMMNGPMGPMGSMYGPYGPMGMGSMMGSMYGGMGPYDQMGGMGGSLYGGSLYGRSMSFNSFGAGSLYGSRAGSFMDSGSSVGGLFAPMSGYCLSRRPNKEIPFFAKSLDSAEEERKAKRKEREVNATRAAVAEAEKPKAAEAPKKSQEEPKKAEPAAAAAAVGTLDEEKGVYCLAIAADDVKVPTGTKVEVTVKDEADKDHTYEVAECVAAKDLSDADKSAVLKHIVTHTQQGHWASVIAVDPSKGTPAVKNTLKHIVKSLVDKLNADSEVTKWKLVCRGAVMSSPTRCKDLHEPEAAEKDAVFGTNPIFGAGIRDLKAKVASNETDAMSHLEPLLSATFEPTEVEVIHYVVMALRKGSTFLSSLVFFITKDPGFLEGATIMDDKRVPVQILRTAFGGAGRTAIVVPITNDKDSLKGQNDALRAASSLCAKPNKDPRSGNASRFIEFSQQQLKKLEQDSAKASGSQKKKLEDMIAKMKSMMDDTDDIHKNFDTAVPDVYPPSEKNREADPAAAAKAEPVAHAGEPFSSIHRLAVITSAPEAAIKNAVEVTSADGKKKSYDVDECIHRQSGKRPLPSAEIARLQSILERGRSIAIISSDSEFTTTPHKEQATWEYAKTIIFNIINSATPEKKIDATVYMVAAENATVLADLITDDKTERPLSTGSSPLFGAAIKDAGGEKIRTTAAVNEVFDRALGNATAITDRSLNEPVIISTIVIKQIDTKAKTVSVASLFVACAKNMKVYSSSSASLDKTNTLFNYALGGPCSTALLVVSPYSEKGPHTELEAELSTQRWISRTRPGTPRSGDVKSFVEYLSKSIATFKEKATAYTDVAEQAKAQKVLRNMETTLEDHTKLLKDPENTEPPIYPFILPELQEAEAGAEAPEKSRSAPADGAKKKTPQTATEEKPHEPVVIQPKKKEDAAAAEETQPDEEGRVPIKVLSIVTEKTSGDAKPLEGWSVTTEANTITLTDVEGARLYSVDEVICREARGDAFESQVLDELQEKFLSGHNVALLTSDAHGSACSLECVDRVARRVMGKMGPKSEMYAALTAYREKEGTTLDTSESDATKVSPDQFTPLHISFSPIVGSFFRDTKLRPVASADEFVKLMTSGLSQCGSARASAVVHMVLVNADGDDVVVSSLLVIMCPGNLNLYRYAMELHPRQRGILAMATSGPCHTVFLSGIPRHPVADDAIAVCNMAQAMRKSLVFPARPGSLSALRSRFEGTISKAEQQRQMSAGDDEKVKRIDEYIAKIKSNEALVREYVADPLGKSPPLLLQSGQSK